MIGQWVGMRFHDKLVHAKNSVPGPYLDKAWVRGYKNTVLLTAPCALDMASVYNAAQHSLVPRPLFSSDEEGLGTRLLSSYPHVISYTRPSECLFSFIARGARRAWGQG